MVHIKLRRFPNRRIWIATDVFNVFTLANKTLAAMAKQIAALRFLMCFGLLICGKPYIEEWRGRRVLLRVMEILERLPGVEALLLRDNFQSLFAGNVLFLGVLAGLIAK